MYDIIEPSRGKHTLYDWAAHEMGEWLNRMLLLLMPSSHQDKYIQASIINYKLYIKVFEVVLSILRDDSSWVIIWVRQPR